VSRTPAYADPPRPSGHPALSRWRGAAAVLAHPLPGVTWAAGLRRRALPGLSGLGSPASVALTFDDGPDPVSTPRLLALLDRLEVRATFFLLGGMAELTPGLTRDVVDAGHELALHGWHHRNSLRVGPRSLLDGLHRAVDVLGELTGRRPTWYRPPYGVVTAGTLAASGHLGLPTVLWSAWGRDWAPTATPSSVLRTLRPDVGPGATVLLHDSDCTSTPGSWRATLGAVEPLVDLLRSRGLRVGPLAAHGVHGGAGRRPELAAAWRPPAG